LATDVPGISYTFQLSNDFAEHIPPFIFVIVTPALAGVGTIVLFSAKRMLDL